MDIQEDERTLLRKLVEQRREAGVELVVDVERPTDQRLGQGTVPDVETPGILRLAVDGVVTLPVEVHFEAGAIDNHVKASGFDEPVRVRILLAEPIGVGEQDPPPDLVP